MPDKAILIDTSKCMGCRGCQVSCKQWNELPAEKTRNLGTYQNPPDLSPSTWTLVRFKEVTAAGQPDWLFRKDQCMHCTEAACIKICPTGAVYHHDLGFVAYDRSKCSGCGYCAEFCPFAVPRMEGDVATGRAVMNKCLFCIDRVANGLTPACAKACPSGAISFGEKDKLVAAGKARLGYLQASSPAASLYGEQFVGGTHVMYVLEREPDAYGLPANPRVPLVATFWQDIIQPLGLVVVGATIAGVAFNYIVARRQIREDKGEE